MIELSTNKPRDTIRPKIANVLKVIPKTLNNPSVPSKLKGIVIETIKDSLMPINKNNTMMTTIKPENADP